MNTEFEMSMIGVSSFFLGLQITQCNKGIFVCQSKYVSTMLEKFGLVNSKHVRTSIGTSVKLSKDISGTPIDATLYHSMIGSLLYLTASRPDICFSVGLCARYQYTPTESHLQAAKRIMRYIASTSTFGIWYTKDTNFSLVGCSDSDCAGSVDDRKSTSGGCFYLGNNLVSWFRKSKIPYHYPRLKLST